MLVLCTDCSYLVEGVREGRERGKGEEGEGKRGREGGNGEELGGEGGKEGGVLQSMVDITTALSYHFESALNYIAIVTPSSNLPVPPQSLIVMLQPLTGMCLLFQ